MSTSGVGGNSLGSPSIDTHKDETTANNQNIRHNLAIVKDNIDVSFTQMGDPYKNYQAASDRPVLPMYITSLAARAKQMEQTPWAELLEEMKESMHPKLQAKLLHQEGLPKNKKDPLYAGLQKGLEWMAESLWYLRRAKKFRGRSAKDAQAILSGRLQRKRNYIEEILKAFEGYVGSLDPLNSERLDLKEALKRAKRIFSWISPLKRPFAKRALKEAEFFFRDMHEKLPFQKFFFLKVLSELLREGVWTQLRELNPYLLEFAIYSIGALERASLGPFVETFSFPAEKKLNEVHPLYELHTKMIKSVAFLFFLILENIENAAYPILFYIKLVVVLGRDLPAFALFRLLWGAGVPKNLSKEIGLDFEGQVLVLLLLTRLSKYSHERRSFDLIESLVPLFNHLSSLAPPSNMEDAYQSFLAWEERLKKGDINEIKKAASKLFPLGIEEKFLGSYRALFKTLLEEDGIPIKPHEHLEIMRH